MAASTMVQPCDLTQPRPRLGSSVSDIDTDVQFEPSYSKTVARLNEFYGQGKNSNDISLSIFTLHCPFLFALSYFYTFSSKLTIIYSFIYSQTAITSIPITYKWIISTNYIRNGRVTC